MKGKIGMYYIKLEYRLIGIASNRFEARGLAQDLNKHIRGDMGLFRATPLLEKTGFFNTVLYSSKRNPKLPSLNFTKTYPSLRGDIKVNFKVEKI